MKSKTAKESMQITKEAKRSVPALSHFSLTDLFKHSGNNALVMLKEDFIQLEHVSSADSSSKPEMSDLFVELFRESFEIAEDDNIGVNILV